MQVKHAPIAMANHIEGASATRPVFAILSAIVFVIAVSLMACRSEKPQETPSITFTKIPPAAQGGRERVDAISGRVRNARPKQQIVIYAPSGQWWVQPWPDRPFIPIQADSTWSAETHLGFEYAALLVEPDYHPLPTTDAHEIKQPIAAAMTSANSCIEWLAHEPPNLDRARAAATRIDKYGNSAAEIIDRMRAFYKKSPPQRELVDVNRIIPEILTLLCGEATRSSVAMRMELAAELPVVMADRVQLQQVFMNLMLNAIEAMQDSGGELKLKSQLEQDGQLLFSVSDTGPGLPAVNVDQIFSAFFTTKSKGSGMGLAISRSIVESHGGRLWATANNGHGAAFHFTLPTHVAESALVI
jgi:signal transduction histidine kinase